MADAIMSGGGFGFLLPATAYEPEDVAFSLASPAIRNRFHAEAGRVAARVWDASRAKGLDRLGRPLAPIAPATVEARRRNRNPVTGQKPYSPMGRASATAPPLTPVGSSSRTRSYLRHRTAPGRGVWFWHKFDAHTRHYWGEILARHGRGFVQRFRSGFRFVPPRDVLGFSEAELAAIRDHMARWWAARQPRAVPTRPLRIEAPPAPTKRQQRRQPAPGSAWPDPDFQRISARGVFTEGASVSLGDGEGGRTILDSGYFQYRPQQGGRVARLAPVRVTPVPLPLSRLQPATPVRQQARPVRFGESRATIANDSATAQAGERLREWLGPQAKPQDLASLIGAPHHAQVRAWFWAGDNNTIIIDGAMPELKACRRYICRHPDGSVTIHNDTFRKQPDARPGVGLLALGRQAENAERLGIKGMDCWAFRGSGWNGYYTWLDYGFDAPVSAKTLLPETLDLIRNCPIESVRTAKYLRDIFRTQAGRDWWSKNGHSVDPAVFDTTSGSYSRRRLANAIRRAIARGKITWKDLES